jgi:hypothetical protein
MKKFNLESASYAQALNGGCFFYASGILTDIVKKIGLQQVIHSEQKKIKLARLAEIDGGCHPKAYLEIGNIK